MSNLQLPIFTEGVTQLSRDLGVSCREGRVQYFYGTLPVFTHAADDMRSFRMFTSQLYMEGKVKQVDLARVFGVSKISVKRSVKVHVEEGPGGFWRERAVRGAAVLTPKVLEQAQALLSQGKTEKEVAAELGLKLNTFQKAVGAGRVHKPQAQAKSPEPAGSSGPELSSPGERNAGDVQAPLGIGASDTEGRMLASLGKGGPADSEFEACADVPKAGVLLAVPALLASGLLEHSEEHFEMPPGYYRLMHLFMLVAFLALARVRSMEGLRYFSPGEWGKMLGLDRAPEVRTLRAKLEGLGESEKVAAWAAQLSQKWMKEDPESAGTLYVDGHVRVYHGSAARLPKHYVPRQKLCLRATTDYWINDSQGRPFFVVHRPVDPGLIKTLKEEIIPRLEKEVPNQPTEAELAADLKLVKFIVAFDREGFSPENLEWLKKRRIGALTYHKHPGPDWPVEEFKAQNVRLAHGNQEEMKLAERATQLSNGLIVREVRQLETSGHQTSVLATAELLETGEVAAGMFARWSQENFLKYMREHYGLDRLLSYKPEKMDETTRVVNPVWRKLDRQVRSLAAKLAPRLARYGKMSLSEPIEPKQAESFMNKKAALQKEIEGLQSQQEEQKAKRAAAEHHVEMGKLPEGEQFDQLSSASKDLVDTIKLVAYRAETAMAQLLGEALPKGRKGEERRLLQSLYASEADLIPDEAAGTLTVRLHHPANGVLARAAAKLCADLTATETVYPTTKLRLVYEVAGVSDQPEQAKAERAGVGI